MNDDSLSQQGDAHVRLEPVRPGAAGFLVRFSLGFLGFCFASFWFCFVLFSSSRSSCCLTFWEMSMRAVILMSGADICQIWRWWQISTMPLSGADFPAVFFKLCHGTKIWKSVQKKGQSTTFCQELIGEIDQDGNGSISFNEFVWLMTRFVFVFVFTFSWQCL